MKHVIFFLLVLLTSCGNTNNCESNKQTIDISVNGIDVSHHNNIPWDSLENYKLDFVYIKASEGKSFKDPKRIENYKNAKAHYSVGFYVFWRDGVSGVEHYRNFKRAIKGCPTDLPPVLDLEDGVRDTVKLLKIIKEIDVFTKLYMKDYGVKPIIYTWYDVAINIHALDSTYKYWLNIGSRNIKNPHKKITVNPFSKVPWVMLQCGKWNFGSGYIDLNYGLVE